MVLGQVAVERATRPAKNQLVTKNEEGKIENALETGGARFWKSKEDMRF